MTIEEQKKLYDDLYIKADALVKKYKPCKSCQLIDGVACCNGYHEGCSKENEPWCQYWNKNGCGAEKPLGCKLWFCREIWQSDDIQNKSLIREIKTIRNIADKTALPLFFRASKNDNFDENRRIGSMATHFFSAVIIEENGIYTFTSDKTKWSNYDDRHSYPYRAI
jgi:hypothetical protein